MKKLNAKVLASFLDDMMDGKEHDVTITFAGYERTIPMNADLYQALLDILQEEDNQ